jgi:RepB DNA-primase from phage plasmid
MRFLLGVAMTAFPAFDKFSLGLSRMNFASNDSIFVSRKGDQIQLDRGSLQQLTPRLQALNSSGHDIWVAVNQFLPGVHRSRQFLSHYRAFYADVDVPGAPDPCSAGLPIPSISVESSPGKRQHYWVFREPVPVADFPEYDAIQAWLVTKVPNADQAAKDSARVLRLPGFANHKYRDRPLVRVIRESTSLYTRTDFLQFAPPLIPRSASIPQASLSEPSKFIAWLRLQKIPKPGSGLRNPFCFKAAAWAVHDLHLAPDNVAEILFGVLQEQQGFLGYDYGTVLGIVENAAKFHRGHRRFEVVEGFEVTE